MEYTETEVPFNWYEIIKKEKDSTGSFEGYRVENWYPGTRGMSMSVGWVSKEVYDDWKERTKHYTNRREWEKDVQLALRGFI